MKRLAAVLLVLFLVGCGLFPTARPQELITQQIETLLIQSQTAVSPRADLGIVLVFTTDDHLGPASERQAEYGSTGWCNQNRDVCVNVTTMTYFDPTRTMEQWQFWTEFMNLDTEPQINSDTDSREVYCYSGGPSGIDRCTARYMTIRGKFLVNIHVNARTAEEAVALRESYAPRYLAELQARFPDYEFIRK